MKKFAVSRHFVACMILGGALAAGTPVSASQLDSVTTQVVTEQTQVQTTEGQATTQAQTTEGQATTQAQTTEGQATTQEQVSTQAQTTQATTKTTTEEKVNNGWNKAKTSYYKNGKKVTGLVTIDKKKYLFSDKGVLYDKTGMSEAGGATYYFDKDHSIQTGFITVNGKAYYFQSEDAKRYEKAGVSKINGKYYYFRKDYSLKTGWGRDTNGKRYYFDKKNYNALTGWNYVGKYKYFFNKKGQLQQDVRKKLTKAQKASYLIRVNRTASCVTVYAKDGLKGYTIPVVAFVCSAGQGTPTGTFSIKDKLRWHELMGPSWGQWCEHLTSDILFHSVFYNRERDNKSLSVSAYNKLGTMASHGCVRLTAGDSKWIYDNCSIGTKVIIYNNKNNPGPFDKPTAQKLSANHTWDPTDPAFKKKK